MLLFAGAGVGVERVALIAAIVGVEAEGAVAAVEVVVGGEATTEGDSGSLAEMEGDAGEFDGESISRRARDGLGGAATVIVVGGVVDRSRWRSGGGGLGSSAAMVVGLKPECSCGECSVVGCGVMGWE